jgi:hypothetical protein
MPLKATPCFRRLKKEQRPGLGQITMSRGWSYLLRYADEQLIESRLNAAWGQ